MLLLPVSRVAQAQAGSDGRQKILLALSMALFAGAFWKMRDDRVAKLIHEIPIRGDVLDWSPSGSSGGTSGKTAVKLPESNDKSASSRFFRFVGTGGQAQTGGLSMLSSVDARSFLAMLGPVVEVVERMNNNSKDVAKTAVAAVSAAGDAESSRDAKNAISVERATALAQVATLDQRVAKFAARRGLVYKPFFTPSKNGHPGGTSQTISLAAELDAIAIASTSKNTTYTPEFNNLHRQITRLTDVGRNVSAICQELGEEAEFERAGKREVLRATLVAFRRWVAEGSMPWADKNESRHDRDRAVCDCTRELLIVKQVCDTLSRLRASADELQRSKSGKNHGAADSQRESRLQEVITLNACNAHVLLTVLEHIRSLQTKSSSPAATSRNAEELLRKFRVEDVAALVEAEVFHWPAYVSQHENLSRAARRFYDRALQRGEQLCRSADSEKDMTPTGASDPNQGLLWRFWRTIWYSWRVGSGDKEEADSIRHELDSLCRPLSLENDSALQKAVGANLAPMFVQRINSLLYHVDGHKSDVALQISPTQNRLANDGSHFVPPALYMRRRAEFFIQVFPAHPEQKPCTLLLPLVCADSKAGDGPEVGRVRVGGTVLPSYVDAVRLKKCLDKRYRT